MNKNQATINSFRHLARYDSIYHWHFGTNGSPYHCHKDFYEFSLITSGSYTHIYNDIQTSLSVGDMLYFRPGESHSLIEDTPDSFHYSIIVQENYVNQFINKYLDNPEVIFSTPFIQKKLSGAEFVFISHLTSNVARTVSDEYLPTLKQFMFNAFYTCFELTPPTPPNTVHIYAVDLKKRLDSYDDVNRNVTLFYTDYPLTRCALIKSFKDLTGMTIVQYRNLKRMEYAALLLREENYSITLVANLLGISNLGYFSSQFKKEYGMTPQEYRKEHKKQ